MKTQFMLIVLASGVLITACKKETPKQIPTQTTTNTPSNANDTSVTDIEGNKYHTVKIGSKLWMKENLKVTKYRNGDSIVTTTPAKKDVSLETTPKYQWSVNYQDSNTAVYGKLYTGYVVTDPRGLCPTGWHVPSLSEFSIMLSSLGPDSVAGGKLKEVGLVHWSSPNEGTTNLSGFTALPAGDRSYYGKQDVFMYNAFFWTSTDYTTTSEHYLILDWYSTHVSKIQYYKYLGNSVRCVRD